MTISWMNESPLLAVQCDLQAFIPYNSKLCKLSVNWFCLGIHSKGKMCTNRRLCDQTVKVLVRCGISNRDFVFGWCTRKPTISYLCVDVYVFHRKHPYALTIFPLKELTASSKFDQYFQISHFVFIYDLLLQNNTQISRWKNGMCPRMFSIM